jgi:hypothetical protein
MMPLLNKLKLKLYDALIWPRWYFDPRHKHDRARLEALHNKHQGERCFIFGNGPSLNQMDLTPLAGEITFGLNRIYLLFDEVGFATTYHVTINRLVIKQCYDEIMAIPSTKFMNWQGARHLVSVETPVTLLRTLADWQFSTDPTRGVWQGATVTFVAMQLAYYMGFAQVILIGVDHSFATKGDPHKVVTSRGDDPNHFAPNYFGKGFKWQLPDLETSEIAYAIARDAFARDGREIVDATVGGKLQVFRKVDYQTMLEQG